MLEFYGQNLVRKKIENYLTKVSLKNLDLRLKNQIYKRNGILHVKCSESSSKARRFDRKICSKASDFIIKFVALPEKFFRKL